LRIISPLLLLKRAGNTGKVCRSGFSKLEVEGSGRMGSEFEDVLLEGIIETRREVD
jgi:hypothetical protein